MTRSRDLRFDFRGGLNVSYTQDLRDSTELVETLNGRLGALYGGVTKRAGTQRVHVNAIGGGEPVLGMEQWDAPGQDGQVVAMSNGSLFVKDEGDSDFRPVYGPNPNEVLSPYDFSAGGDWNGDTDFTVAEVAGFFPGESGWQHTEIAGPGSRGQDVGTLSSGPETFAIVVRNTDSVETSWAIFDPDAGGHVARAEFNFSTETASIQSSPEGTGAVASAVEIDDGVWLLTVTVTPNNPGNDRRLLWFCSPGGTATDTITIYGVALQVGATNGFSTTQRPSFIVHAVGTEGPKLYFGEGSGLFKFDGAFVTEITGPTVPDATELVVHRTRVFAGDGSQNLRWSAALSAEDWSVAAGGSFAPVQTYDTEPVSALADVGAVMMVFKENSIARFQGVSISDIQIEADTQGISNDVGCVAPRTVARMEEAVFFLTDRGPYIASQAGVQAIGVKVEPLFDVLNDGAWSNAVAVAVRSRREMWIFGPSSGSTENDTGYIYNWRTQEWSGPWELSFNVASAARYERANGSEGVILGGYDGFVRDGDVEAVGARDDVLLDGTGGTNIKLRIKTPELFFGDPRRGKRMDVPCYVAADLGEGGRMCVKVDSEMDSPSEQSVDSRRDGPYDYEFIPYNTGSRLVVTVEESTPEIVTIQGLNLEARVGRRKSA